MYTINGNLMHMDRSGNYIMHDWGNHKYIDKIKTATGKWRYIYDTKISGASAKKRMLTSQKEINKNKDRIYDLQKGKNAAYKEIQKFNKSRSRTENANQKIANNYKSKELSNRYLSYSRNLSTTEKNLENEKKENQSATEDYRKSLAGKVNEVMDRIQEKLDKSKAERNKKRRDSSVVNITDLSTGKTDTYVGGKKKKKR